MTMSLVRAKERVRDLEARLRAAAVRQMHTPLPYFAGDLAHPYTNADHVHTEADADALRTLLSELARRSPDGRV